MELVSIIIPCYNSAKLIEESILSVVQQTGFDLEIICVDNNSTDNTLEVLNELQIRYKYIIVTTETKKGASYAREKGLALATGKYIQFLDSDDIILPGKFKAQIEKIEAQKLDWVLSDRSVLNYDLTKINQVFTFENFMNNPIGFAISEVITSGNPIYKREIVLKVGGYTPNLKVGQDWDFHIKLVLANSKFNYEPGDYFHSRTVEGSLSSNWFDVSKTLCSLIELRKQSFFEKGILTNSKALSKIHHVYFNTAIFTTNKTLMKKCEKELIFWTKKTSLSQSLQGKSKLLIKVLGASNSIRLMRVFSRKMD